MTSRCRCCRRTLRGPYVQIVTMQNVTERLCPACCAHIRLTTDGAVRYPDRCPDAPPESRPFPPAGWRVLP